MEVVILSAGRGKRIGQGGGLHLPNKPFLKLKGETIIEREFRLLRELGVSNIKIVAGDNESDIKRLIPNATFMHTKTNHKNALRELADICRVTKERKIMLALLGDLVFTKRPLKEMLEVEKGGITVFGGSKHVKGAWWNKYPDEIFAVKLKDFYIQQGRTLFGTMPLKYYELKNIAPQLELQRYPIKECYDIDIKSDYAHILGCLKHLYP